MERKPAFQELLERLVRVTKGDVERQERDYQKHRRKNDEPAKPKQIVPSENVRTH